MHSISSDVLDFSNEAVLLAQKGKVIYANHAAKSIFGSVCEGKTLAALLGKDISSTQAPLFSASLRLGMEERVIRSVVSGSTQALYISRPEVSPSMLSDAFLCSLRSDIMLMRLTVDSIRGKDGADGSEQLRMLTQSYYRLSRLVSNACVIKDTVHGEPALFPRLYDLAEIVRDLANSANYLLDGVSVSYYGEESLTVNCDKALIEQLVLNLIANAVTHAKGIEHISLGVMKAGAMAYIAVSNDGSGMEQDELANVFFPGRREFTPTRVSRGAGLGMTAVRCIASAHMGTVLMESRPETGTRIMVSVSSTLPEGKLSSPTEPYAQADSMDSVLTGLADCLPPERFSSRLLD